MQPGKTTIYQEANTLCRSAGLEFLGRRGPEDDAERQQWLWWDKDKATLWIVAWRDDQWGWGPRLGGIGDFLRARVLGVEEPAVTTGTTPAPAKVVPISTARKHQRERKRQRSSPAKPQTTGETVQLALF